MSTVDVGRRLSSMLCRALKGVGPAIANKLAKCHIVTLQDLLFHLPSRYEDRTHLVTLSSVKAGSQALVEGMIADVKRPVGGKTRLLCQLQDETGYLHCRFFYINRAQVLAFVPGVRVRLFGDVRFGPAGLEMVHPEYTVLRKGVSLPVDKSLTPVYPTTDGLHQATFRKLMQQALSALDCAGLLDELVPVDVLSKAHFPSLAEAITLIHRPPSTMKKALSDMHPCYQRLAFEELLAHRLSLLRLRDTLKQHKGIALPVSKKLKKAFLAALPFTLTGAQCRVGREIESDLTYARPMMRLVQGDVGSGKTVVAAMAALQAIEQGYQVAIMAPTDILATQHYHNFSEWFALLDLPVVFLSGKLAAKARREAMQMILNTPACIVIGTHALFQEDVVFNQLALIIIDEQHRFGVDQRLRLKQKSALKHIHPHQLIMTATPIPRTLAMTAFADLDNSIIDELPPGRTPVKTVLVNCSRRDEIIARILKNTQAGRQVYWVCTLIEESDVLQCQAAEECVHQLTVSLPSVKIALVHGRLKSADKNRIMQQFKAGQIDVLVATTVIEVGVDVPNATIMVIENAERLGLSQLHQLRGRVGRGSTESFCVLLYQMPLSQHSKTRLDIMRDHHDGFVVAQKDLELRGPGEVLGTRQTGIADFRIADVVRDQALLPEVASVANAIMQSYPACISPLIERWLRHRDQYGQV